MTTEGVLTPIGGKNIIFWAFYSVLRLFDGLANAARMA